MRITESAQKHGITDEDMLHAIRLARREVPIDDELSMCLGPARDGSLLEVGVVGLETDDPVVVHAMRLRPKFYPYL